VGAPTGSIYHRFDSRDVLLAKVWLRAAGAFQSAFLSPPPYVDTLIRATYSAALRLIKT